MISLPLINFRERQNRAMGELSGNALLVVAQPQAYRNSTVEASWRQDSLFYYLTGFSETDAVLLILSHRSASEPRVLLFLRDKDAVAELWNGRRLGVAKAKTDLPIDEAYPIQEFWSKLPSLLTGSKGLTYALGHWTETDRKVIESLRSHKSLNARHAVGILPVKDSAELSAVLRIQKDDTEIARMKKAASITKNAFINLLKTLEPGQNERQIHAGLLHDLLKGGAELEAYGSIVAAGSNACVLHYRENNANLRDGDLILIDAGCQVENYASDVTRTYPINGKFSRSQKLLYEICLKSQIDAIREAKPGATWQTVQNRAFRTLTEGLIDIGLIKVSVDEALEKNVHKHFCPHSISHWIGLDVHDAGFYMDHGEPVLFKPGMYFSVEPGIYINEDDQTVPEEFRGIGIRIEDDVLITASGAEVLTAGIPKDLAEIEQIYHG